MLTSTAAFFAGYLFMASATPLVEAPSFRDRGVYASSTPMGYSEFCASEPGCDPVSFLGRRALLQPDPVNDLRQSPPAGPAMVVKERRFGDRVMLASAVPGGDTEERRMVRPVILPMLLKEHWFRNRIIIVAAVAPAASPTRSPLPHNERWLRDRVVKTAAVVPAAGPTRSPLPHNERWLSDRVVKAAAVAPSASRTRSPLPHNERWLSDRVIKAAAVAPAASPTRSPMPYRERWLRDRVVKAAPSAGKPAQAHPTLVPMVLEERWSRSRIFATATPGSEPSPSPKYTGGEFLPKGGGRQQIGKPYKVAGRWYTPKKEPAYDVEGIASWYGSAFHRRMTSNGEWFDMEYLSAAHPTMPLPSYAKVTNIDNGKEIIVRVNDRGPFAGGRIIDVSKKCAESLGFKKRGTANVRVQFVGAAPLDDRGSHLRAMNRELRGGTAFDRMLVAADNAVRTLAAADTKPGRAF